MAEATQTITFKSGEPYDPTSGISLSAELNEEKNNGETEFAFSSGVCWINVLGSIVQGPDAEPPAADVSAGNISGGNIIMADAETKISMEGVDYFERRSLSGGYGVEITEASFIGKGSLGVLSESYVPALEYSAFVNSGGNLLGELTVKYKVMARLYKITNVPKPADYDDAENPGLRVVSLFIQGGKATVTSTFKSGGDAEFDSVSLSAELNEEKNDGETEFAFNSGVCWINLYGSVNDGGEYDGSIITDVSSGVISGGQEILYETETKITMERVSYFDRSRLNGAFSGDIIDASFVGKGTLGSLFGVHWLDDNGEWHHTIRNSGGRLLGELTVKYNLMSRLYKITNVPKPDSYDDEENPGLNVVAYFCQKYYGPWPKTTISATFKNIGVEAPRRVKVKVVNHCSGDPVPGAIVTLGGGLTGGVTGDDGMIDIGMVAPGTYSVIDIVKSGFEPPASDVLDNEEIEIPSEEPA